MAVLAEEKNIAKMVWNSEELENKIAIATQTLDRNIAFITNCDSKTSIVLTAVGVLLTIILTNDGLNEIFNIFKNCIKTKTFCSVVYFICFASSALIMIAGMFILGSVLVAKTSEEAKGVDEGNSRIFFSGIIKNGDYKIYRSKFYLMNQEELLEELVSQIYINADIAMQKYKKYNFGLKHTILGFLLFILFLLIGIYLY